MQPVLFIIVFGYLLPRMGFIREGYTSALLPGILAVSLTLSSVQSVALPMVQDFGFTREIEDRLLAPVPIYLIAVEKVVSGALQGVIAAAVVLPIARLIMGPIQGLHLPNAGLALGVTLLGSTVFASLGLVIGTAISAQQIGLMFSIIIAPMLMFGCAYYPWRGLDAVPAFKYGVLLNPLVYVAEAMRGALTPSLPHMPLGYRLRGDGAAHRALPRRSGCAPSRAARCRERKTFAASSHGPERPRTLRPVFTTRSSVVSVPPVVTKAFTTEDTGDTETATSTFPRLAVAWMQFRCAPP